MFNAQIDVAKIMEKIKADAAQKHSVSVPQAVQHANTEMVIPNIHTSFSNYDAIRNELSRIDTYVYNTNRNSEEFARIGEKIRMSPRSKGLGRKLKILLKRFFRKGTRFIAEDQIEVNNNTINSIRALCEYNSAFLPVLDNINDLYMQNSVLCQNIEVLNNRLSELSSRLEAQGNEENNKLSELASRLEAQGNEENNKLSELASRFEAQGAETDKKLGNLDSIYAQQNAEINNIIRRFDDAEERTTLRAEEQTKEYNRRLGDFERCVDIISERFNGIEHKVGDMSAALDKTEKTEQIISDDMYAKFLDKHRGDEAEITRRLRLYLTDLNRFDLNTEKPHLVIDLGCGRGEFLGVLKEEGINCIGVDLNDVSVEYCKENGFNVVCDDAINYLKNAQSESADLITAFQLIEHISLTQLNELIVEAERVLKPHGKLIMETPYSRNVEVGAYSFYTDPTHVRPVNDNFVRFLCEEAGFTKTSLYLWKTAEIDNWMDSVFKSDTSSLLDSATVRMMLNEMKQKWFVSPDYAVIAEK